MPGVLAVLTGEDVKADLGWAAMSAAGWSSPGRLAHEDGPAPAAAGAGQGAAMSAITVAVVVADSYQQARMPGEALRGRL
ncbi:MAG: hypothetical protein U1E17_08975 [Geminicoccaceae bacterium]